MSSIDVGSPAIFRPGFRAFSTDTFLEKANPSNGTGSLDTVEIYLEADGTDCKIGTFYGSGTSWTSRDYTTIGSVPSGSTQTFSGLDIAVETGDLIGVYLATGQLVRASGGTGYYIIEGDQFGTGTQTYTSYGTYSSSLYGTGETAPTSSIAAIAGVTLANIASVAGVAKASIAAVGGVANV